MESEHTQVLYESVADDISALIHSGTLVPGERVPSVRRLSRQRRVSISTVLQAYTVLENRGLIEARPQSGYYVRQQAHPASEPAVSKPPRSPQLVGVHALVSRILEDGRRPDVVRLDTAIPSAELVPTAKLQRMVSTVARRQPQCMATYAFPPGREELRRQIALRARDWGVSLTADEIVITNGCIEAVNLCLRAVAKAGDVIALESPTFFGLLQIIESLGMKALEIPTHPRDGISLDALQLALERERIGACLLMPNVSNPLGSTMPERNKKRLVKMLAGRDVPLIEDAVYADLAFGAPPLAAKAFDRTGNIMLCSSFTKTFAPGFRVGWVAPGRYFPQVQMLKFISSVGVSDLLQLAIAEFLENGGHDRLMRTLRRTYAHQMELVKHAIARHFPQETKVTRPGGGFVLWVEMPEGVDSIELHRQALKEAIGLAPGPMFSASNRYRNFVRVNCGLPWSARVERALMRVGELARQQIARAGLRRRQSRSTPS